MKIKSKKLHYLYLGFPVIILIFYLLMQGELVRYTQSFSGNMEISGMIYKAKKTQYGYQLFLRKNILDKERVIISSQKLIAPGQYITVAGIASDFATPTNPGEFNSKNYYNSLNVAYKLKLDNFEFGEKTNYLYYYAYMASDYLEKGLYKIADEKYASVFAAILLGRKDELNEEISDLFSACGIGHILAISGLHISIIGMGLYKLIRRAGANYVVSMIVCTIIILFYGLMTGNGVSTVRALIMFIVAVYANVVGRTYDMISAAMLSLVITLSGSPLLIYNSGYLLSYMAILGIVYIIPALKKLFVTKKKILNGLLASLSIQMATLPIILYYFFQFPVFSVFLNILVIPLMTIVMISGILGMLLTCISPILGCFTIGPAVYVLKFFEFLCGLWRKNPFAIYTSGRPLAICVIIFYGLIIVFVILVNKYGRRFLILIPMVASFLILFRFDFYFEMTFIDVGQGDGIFIKTPKGTTFLVDGGSSSKSNLYDYTLRPFLLSGGVASLDYVIITHCDSDHVSGIKAMITSDDIQIKTILLPSTTLMDEEYEELVKLALSDGIEVSYIYTGMSFNEGDFSISCLHPSYQFETQERNAYSTTLLVSYKDFSALLTGDISTTQEELILEKGIVDTSIDVLKAAHHGSKYSNSAKWLNAITPELVVISCGKGNSYGHPHGEALTRFKEVGAMMQRTDEVGAVRIRRW